MLTMESMKMDAEIMQMGGVEVTFSILDAPLQKVRRSLQEKVKQMGGVDKVYEVMDEVEDAMFESPQDVINRARPGIDADDDKLLAELDGLM